MVAAVTGPELQGGPDRAGVVAQRDGALEFLLDCRAFDRPPVLLGDAAVQFGQLPEGLLAQLAGLALLDHREVAVGDRLKAGLVGPAAGGVLGPAVAAAPVEQHAAKTRSVGLLALQQLGVGDRHLMNPDLIGRF